MSTPPEGPLPIPASDHELPHRAPDGDDDLPWKDTWWFTFRDDAADVTGAVHLTLSPNRLPGCRVTVAIRHGARQVVDWTTVEPELAEGDFGCPWLRVEVIEPEWSSAKRLRLQFGHPAVQGCPWVGGGRTTSAWWPPWPGATCGIRRAAQ